MIFQALTRKGGKIHLLRAASFALRPSSWSLLLQRYNLLPAICNLSICWHKDVNKSIIVTPVSRRYQKIVQRDIHTWFRLFSNTTSSYNASLFIQRKFHSSALKFQLGSPNSGNNDPNKNKNNNEDDKKLIGYGLAWIILGYTIITIISMLFPPANKPDVLRYVSWNEFYHKMLAKGEVELIVVKPDLDLVTIFLYEGAVIGGKRAPYRSYHMNIFNVPTFEARLREAEATLGIKSDQSVQIIYERNQENVWFAVVSIFAVAALLSFFLRSSSVTKGPLGGNLFSNLRRAKFTVIDPLMGDGKGVRFADVAGLREAKVEIMEFVDYLQAPERFKALGAKVPKGVLLLGPPGCGKTMLAKAVATEASVPFLAMNGSEFIEMIGGLGAARVRDLFAEARKRSPCIVYVDEIDAIGRQRGGQSSPSGSSGEEEQTLNQLLVEMDGMSQREGIIMLASTNRADVLDRALLRPGRFDRHILIDYPTLDERKDIFVQHLKPIRLSRNPEDYATRLAQLTPGFTGADIANVANEAALHAARTAKVVVDTDDLEMAVERVIGGPEKRSTVISANERRVMAFHECGHALVGWLLPQTDALLKVSIVPRTTNVLGFAQYLPTDRQLYTEQQLFERMCMALGGRAAECITFNHVSSGAQDDLRKVTQMAYTKIQVYGMDDIVGPLSFDYETNRFARKPYSKRLASTIDQRARRLVAHAYQVTEQLLNDNRDKLRLMAEQLLQRETLNYADIESLIGPSPHGKKTLVESFDIGSLVGEHAPRPHSSNRPSSDGEDIDSTANRTDSETNNHANDQDRHP